MKTLNVNVKTPTQEEINEMVELFTSMSTAVKGWDDKDNALIVDLLLDVDAKAIKTQVDWDALIPGMEIYDTVVSDLHAEFDAEVNVAIMTTVIKPEWYETVAGVIPQTYIDHGVTVLDPINSTIATRFNNLTTEPFNDVKNGIEINFVKVA